MATKTRSVPENFDTKKALNPLEAKILRHQQNTANVPLDSGAIAKLPHFDQPIDRRGPFDMGLLPTWILYGILIVLVIVSIVGLVLCVLGLTMTLFGVLSTQNQQIKFFGVVISSTVLTSSATLLICFGVQHAKEVGWVPSGNAPDRKRNMQQMSQNAKISALYSIDPSLQQDSNYFPQTPVSPSQLDASLKSSSKQRLISN